jgi:hypothetical protein
MTSGKMSPIVGMTSASLRNNARMQESLRNAGLDEGVIATNIVNGIKQLRPGKPQLGYIMAGAEQFDVFPSKKIEDVTPPKGYTDLEAGPKPKTLAEAQRLADQKQGS